MLNNLMYVTVYVSDQDQALEFYVGGLGLEKRIDYPGPDGRFLTVAPAGEATEIILWPAVAPAPQPLDKATSSVVPGSVFLESDDLYAEFPVLRSRGVAFVESEPTPYPFGVRLTAIDPDGNRIELRQRRPGPTG